MGFTIIAATAALVAIAFPRVAAGVVAQLVLAACGGVLAARIAKRLRLSRLLAQVTPNAAGWCALATVSLVALYALVPVLDPDAVFLRGDWGPQHAVLRSVVDHLRDLELPNWHHGLATGDAPLDVYPSLTYVVAGAFALGTGLDDRLPFVLLLFASLAHTLVAVNATRLALRFLPAPLAAAIGVLLVLDHGSISSGGVIGTIQTGLLHSAVAQVFALAAVVGVVDAIRRPRLRTSIAIWLTTALATAAHPAGLLASGVTLVALLAVAALARDVLTRRSVVAGCHVLLGVALGASVWLPLGKRLLLYGQHFSDVLPAPAHWLGGVFSSPIP
ncbi:MAG TPA: hypothetical protein VK427_11150, partial [Kofleriaceae bacterium]|nr:hypothetical protein [Kofleriaceae bacterium]